MMRLKRNKFLVASLIIISAGLLLLSIWPAIIQAGPPLPPRTPPAPTSPPTSNDEDSNGDNDDDQPLGAYIELQVQPGKVGLWSAVQWQDSSKNWRVVEGWQGALNRQGYRRWWVDAKDFGKGPFRWAVYQGQNGELLATSSPFSLPQGANEVVRVELSLQ